MTIWFITNDARDEAGGAFHSQKALIESLNRAGHKTVMIATKKRGGEKTQSFEVRFMTAKGDLGRLFQLKTMIASDRPDAVVGNMNPQIILVSLASLFPSVGCKVFGIFRMGDDFMKLGHSVLYLPLRRILGWIFSKLDGAIAISDFTAEIVQKTYYLKQKPTTIYNPFDLAFIRDRAANDDPQFTKKTIVSVGRLCPQKAQRYLVLLAEKLREKREDFEILIIGEGGDRAMLETMIAEGELGAFVKLLGHQQNPFSFMARADCFVLTSAHEGFGRVVAESMALGVPVVAFRAPGGGHIELLENGRGFLAPFGDIDALATIVNNLFDSPATGQIAAQKASEFVETLTTEKIAAQLVDLIISKFAQQSN
ncbi:hypothetical protein AGMMS50229_17540 [Campylobacterota bacterium]|nr:hypothetical protein AGMMS50229_17540 [Campylobacterota bacterium]